MIRDEYLRRLVDAAHIELYLSANDGARVYWPWRMQPPSEASLSYRDACERYIIDSDPLDDSVTTVDVLDTAARLDAEVASLQDVYQDCEATIDSLLDGLAVADDHPFDGDLLLPLQEPFDDCWRELGEPTGHLLGIGGLKDADDRERINAALQLRAAAGDDVWIHGFGWGPRGRLADMIVDDPGLIDSVDYSTPVQNATSVSVKPGTERMSVVAANAAATLVQDLRRVSPYVAEPEADDLRDDRQGGLEQF